MRKPIERGQRRTITGTVQDAYLLTDDRLRVVIDVDNPVPSTTNRPRPPADTNRPDHCLEGDAQL